MKKDIKAWAIKLRGRSFYQGTDGNPFLYKTPRCERIEQVAKVGKRMHGPEPLQNSMWRHWVRLVAFWLLVGLLGLLWWGLLLLFWG